MVKSQGGNGRMLKLNNKASILKSLFFEGAMSRIALSKALGLTGAAITMLVKELFEEGMLLDCGEKLQRNASGRKEVLIDINYDVLTAFGINIESDKIHFALCTPKKVIKEEIRSTSELFNAEDKVEYLYNIISNFPAYNTKPLGI